ncbi:MAG: hypothetical protein M9962_11945 [Oligoflexia bacterium]|nr:hypothetical protein [Oligoflexia bacterium]
MNIKWKKSGLAIKLSPEEFVNFNELKKLHSTFPINSTQSLLCDLILGESFLLELRDMSLNIVVTKEMLQELYSGIKTGKKSEHEIKKIEKDVIFSLEIDYFKSKSFNFLNMKEI